MIDYEKQYDALLIDTSIYEKHGLRLEKGLLKRLFQFRMSPIIFLLPDVIKNEVQAHLEQKIRSARSLLEKSLNEAGDHLFFVGSALNDAKEILIDSNEIEGLAESRVAQFLDNTQATELNCGDYISIDEILSHYFSEKPPFASTGKKKSEFPDAIVLLAADAWASAEDKTILAVARDGDWDKYCESSPRIDCTEDLSAALDVFNKANAPYALIIKIQEELADGSAGSFLKKIAHALERSLDGFTPEQIADSYLYWEPEGSYGWFEGFEFISNEFHVVDAGADWVTLEGLASIQVGAEGDFSLSVYDSVDKDYTYMGGVTVTTEQEFQTQILITISGNLDGPLDDMEILEVEVVDQIYAIDFGTIEPDWSGEEDYE